MLETLHRYHCFACLVRTSQERHPRIVVICPARDTIDAFTYEPTRYAKKRPDAEPEPLPLEIDA